MSTATWIITPATPADRRAWQRLYLAYGEVAGQALSGEHLARVWSWILDPQAQTRCLLLREHQRQEVVGLAHYRLFERPLAGSIGCWLDDLFVDPAQRGRGGARAGAAAPARDGDGPGVVHGALDDGADQPRSGALRPARAAQPGDHVQHAPGVVLRRALSAL